MVGLLAAVRGGVRHARARIARLRQAATRRSAWREAARITALYEFATLLAGERELARLLAALVAGLDERFDYRYPDC